MPIGHFNFWKIRVERILLTIGQLRDDVIDYSYQNALMQAIVFSIFSFVKKRSCVTQIYITKIAAKCILVVVVN